MGAIFEFEGVIVEDCAEEHRQARRFYKVKSLHVACSTLLTRACRVPQAWLSLAEELGKSPPPAYMLKKAIGMKSAQVGRESNLDPSLSTAPAELPAMSNRRMLGGGGTYAGTDGLLAHPDLSCVTGGV